MRKVWLCCLFLLSACGKPAHATPIPTSVLIEVALTPSLRPYAEALHACAAILPELVINIYETPTPILEYQTFDLSIQLGQKPGNGYILSLGDEPITLVVNKRNPVFTIPEDKIVDIFVGRVNHWSEAGGEQRLIQVWVYPTGDDTREVVDRVMFLGESVTPGAFIAPDPQAMLEAVGNDPFAIGYIPQTWLAYGNTVDQVRPLQLEQELVERLHQPVLAYTQAEPEGLLWKLLVCLQNADR